MKPIKFDIWEPVPGEPGKVQRTGQRTAQEVFSELKHRLECTGLLPDEYFLMDDHWRNGREIPADAALFCTADYGGSEGIYLDVYLKWHQDGKTVTQSFITGKTLDESGVALDRMHLVASAIMKSIRNEDHIHRPQGTVLHLNPAEHRLMIDSLVQRREMLKEDFSQTEQLLRRATDGILEYINEVGERPLRIRAYDQAVLAVHDGDFHTFEQQYPSLPDEQLDDLFVQAAARPGAVGRKMTLHFFEAPRYYQSEAYLTACKLAVDTGDLKRVGTMLQNAALFVEDYDPALCGEVIRYAYVENKRHISTDLIKQCSLEQIAAANPALLYIAAMNGDYHTCMALVEKGLDGGEHTGRIVHTLIQSNNGWILERMVEMGFQTEGPAPQALDEPQMGGMQ